MSKSINQILVYIALLVLILCGGFIRIYGLSDWAFNPDDVMHLSYATAPTALDTFKVVLWHNTHSPGFFVILYYMLKISHNELFLYSISLIPGIILIPSFYALGTIYKGRAAGLFMAFIATFSIELIVSSEAIRQYNLLLVLESWALYALFRYDKTGKFSYLVGYGLLSLIAIHMNYTSVIFIIACGVVWFCSMVLKRNRRDIIGWVLIHTVLAGMFLVLFILKYQTNTLHTDMQFVVYNGVTAGFPTDIGKLLTITFYLLFFNHHPFSVGLFVGPLMYLITMFGVIYIFKIYIKTNEYKVLALIGIALLVNIILTLAKLYPMMEGRHCLYLLPFVLLVPAFGVQYAVDYVYGNNISQEKRKWLVFLPMVCFIGSVGYGLMDVQKRSYYRYTYRNDFLMTKKEYTEMMDYIFNATKKGDIIITERCFVDYLFYEKRSRSDDKVIGRIHHLTYKGRELYYTDSTSSDLLFWQISDLQDFLQQLSTVVPAVKHQQLWFFSAGWPSIYNKLINEKKSNNDSIQNNSKQAIAIAALAHEFVHSDQVSHRVLIKDIVAIESGFVTNWQFLEKTLLSKEMIEIFHEKNSP